MAGEILLEDVPLFKRRAGDVTLAGRNNALIVLGRDRDGDVASGFGAEAGTGSATVVVGLQSEDPSIVDDSATLYLSMKSDPTGLDVSLSGVGSVAVVRADRIVLSSREQTVIKVGAATLTLMADGSVIIEGDVSLGRDASDRLLKEPFATWAANHIHPDPASGFTGKPTIPPPETSYCPRARSS